MSAPLFDDQKKTAFVDAVKAAIEADKTPALIRCELGERFGLDTRQVKNALTRFDIDLFETREGLRGTRDLSEAEQAKVIARAKELLDQGCSGIRVRAMLSIEFHIFETSAAKMCSNASSIDLRVVKVNHCFDGPDIPLEKADYDARKDIFLQAADKLRAQGKSVRFDDRRDQWFLEHRPVSRIKLAQSAGIGV